MIKAAIFLGFVSASVPAGTDQVARQIPQEKLPLSDLVSSYLQAKSPGGRTELAAAVEEAAGGSCATVADVLRGVNLWALPESPQGTMVIDKGETGEPIELTYRVPSGYDPAKPHPLLFCQPEATVSPERTLDRAAASFDTALRGFILVCPRVALGAGFAHTRDSRATLPGVMKALRRRFHIDSDRVFLYGENEGADAAWLSALLYSDLFAGAVVLSGYPNVPYPEQTLWYLLENLRSMRVVAAWSDVSADAMPRPYAVAEYHRAILDFANRTSLGITGIMLNQNADMPTAALTAEVSALLSGGRSWPPTEASHWFRYPDQGRAGWLRQAQPEEPVWHEDQLSILAAPTANRNDFIKKVVQERLSFLKGSFKEEHVTIEAKRCARIDVLVPFEWTDVAGPVTIRCNGALRYEGLIKPSIPTLLETAYEEWDFQHLIAARLSFSVRPRESDP